MATKYLYASLGQTNGVDVPVRSNVASATWQTLTDDDGQWDAGWVANNEDRGIQSPWDARYDGLVLPGDGAYLLGFLYTVSAVTPPRGTICQFGRVDDAGALRGLRIWQDSTGSVVFDFFDDRAGTPQRLRKFMNDAGAPGEELALFCYLDNRADRIGSRSLMLFRYEPGSILMKQQGQPIDISSDYLPISGGAADERKQIRLGYSMDASGGETAFLTDGYRIRNLVVFNFGQQAPAGVNKVMEALSLNRLVPTRDALSLAGATFTKRLFTREVVRRGAQ